MLQALASERELLVSLFGDMDAQQQQDGAKSGALQASPRHAGDGSDTPDTAALLDQVFESICRPLKVHPVPPRILRSSLARLCTVYGLGMLSCQRFL